MSYSVITLRLTADNVETAFKPGDAFTDDPEFGIVTNAWLVHGGTAAKVFTDRDVDVIGLPQTARITRVLI